MRGIISVLTVMALVLAVMAVPAFAAVNGNTNCVGGASELNQNGKEFGGAGLGGKFVANLAQKRGGLGGTASTNSCGG